MPQDQVEAAPNVRLAALNGKLPSEISYYGSTLITFNPRGAAECNSPNFLFASNETIFAERVFLEQALRIFHDTLSPLFALFGYSDFAGFMQTIIEFAGKLAGYRSLTPLVMQIFEAGMHDGTSSAQCSLGAVQLDTIFHASFKGPEFEEARKQFHLAE